MNVIQKKIKEFLRNWDFNKLSKDTWLSNNVLISFFENKNRKYTKNTMDILYDFFHLEIDDFYKENVKKWYPKTNSLFWYLLRTKRTNKNIMIEDLAKMIKIERRTLSRIESGDTLPTNNSYTINHLIDVLWFTEEEKNITNKYINVMRELIEIVKNNETN